MIGRFFLFIFYMLFLRSTQSNARPVTGSSANHICWLTVEVFMWCWNTGFPEMTGLHPISVLFLSGCPSHKTGKQYPFLYICVFCIFFIFLFIFVFFCIFCIFVYIPLVYW